MANDIKRPNWQVMDRTKDKIETLEAENLRLKNEIQELHEIIEGLQIELDARD